MDEEIPLGSVIARARQRKRWTQADLAERVGVGREAVSTWEIGQHYPKRHLGLIEEVLGIDLSAYGKAS